MEKKTEELRDIFMDVTDEETVTETQEETHGSLGSEADVEQQLLDAVAEMRDALTFETDLSDDEYVAVVRGFYAGDPDADIAADLDDVDPDGVARARVDLHLFRDADTDAPFDLAELRDLVEAGASVDDCAADLDADEATVRRFRRVVEAQDAARRVNHRFTDEFENVLRDREISDRMTENVQQDGLDDATEGMETNVSF
ncbi:conditioned medium-induced protein 4 [Halomicrococcus gelatinilyticus]|uniref:conditioned medium-induced protein 4 n=1 Tax=Halomicrococcus gelatinilyticus TaxID=1702103 RepID=UPI002E12F699